MDTTTTEPTKRTITLTNHAPVTIREDAWPIISSARWWRGEIESQADRKWWMKVRRHADGRTIVYGGYTTRWQGEHDRKAGELLNDEGPTTVVAIRMIAAELGAPDDLVRAMIADLPAVEIE
jgi:hypothetical protein